MIVRSNIITREDIANAVRLVPAVSFQDTFSREGWFVPIREFRPRRYARGFEFFLSGSSSHRAQHDPNEFAATWIEWGVVIDALYRLDSAAKIGWYDGYADFYVKTENDYRVRLGEIAREDVPWLN